MRMGKGEGEDDEKTKNIYEECTEDKAEMAEDPGRISSRRGEIHHQLVSKEGR